MLLHTSINPTDVSAIYLAYKAEVSTFCPKGLKSRGTYDELAWSLGIWPSPSDYGLFPPLRVELSDGPAFLGILTGAELSILIVFSEPHSIELSAFNPVKGILAPFARNLIDHCKGLKKSDGGQGIEFLRMEGQFGMKEPVKSHGRLSDREKTDGYLRFIGEQKLAFTRAVVQLGQPAGWLFMEQFGEQTTLVAASTGRDVTLGDSVQYCLRELKQKKFVC
jgi:hypothetical protein